MRRVSEEYAKGLYDLASDENLTERILQEMRFVDEIFRDNADYLRVLSAPNIVKEERCGLLDRALRGKVHPYILNLLKILTEKNVIRHVSHVALAYEQLYQEAHGIMPVTATTAIPLDAEQKTRLEEKLEKITGKKVTLQNTVDSSMLGGVRLDFDGKRMDDSVRHRLDALRGALEKTTL